MSDREDEDRDDDLGFVDAMIEVMALEALVRPAEPAVDLVDAPVDFLVAGRRHTPAPRMTRDLSGLRAGEAGVNAAALEAKKAPANEAAPVSAPDVAA